LFILIFHEVTHYLASGRKFCESVQLCAQQVTQIAEEITGFANSPDTQQFSSMDIADCLQTLQPLRWSHGPRVPMDVTLDIDANVIGLSDNVMWCFITEFAAETNPTLTFQFVTSQTNSGSKLHGCIETDDRRIPLHRIPRILLGKLTLGEFQFDVVLYDDERPEISTEFFVSTAKVQWKSCIAQLARSDEDSAHIFNHVRTCLDSGSKTEMVLTATSSIKNLFFSVSKLFTSQHLLLVALGCKARGACHFAYSQACDEQFQPDHHNYALDYETILARSLCVKAVLRHSTFWFVDFGKEFRLRSQDQSTPGRTFYWNKTATTRFKQSMGNKGETFSTLGIHEMSAFDHRGLVLQRR
jgi:hypothetical protein